MDFYRPVSPREIRKKFCARLRASAARVYGLTGARIVYILTAVVTVVIALILNVYLLFPQFGALAGAVNEKAALEAKLLGERELLEKTAAASEIFGAQNLQKPIIAQPIDPSEQTPAILYFFDLIAQTGLTRLRFDIMPRRDDGILPVVVGLSGGFFDCLRYLRETQQGKYPVLINDAEMARLGDNGGVSVTVEIYIPVNAPQEAANPAPRPAIEPREIKNPFAGGD